MRWGIETVFRELKYTIGLNAFHAKKRELIKQEILSLIHILGQLVSGYLDFAERQAEREQIMTMEDWVKHLDNILTVTGEQLLVGNGSVTHQKAMEKAETCLLYTSSRLLYISSTYIKMMIY